MSKKKQPTYAETSRERRARRLAEQEKANAAKKKAEDSALATPAEEVPAAEGEAAVEQKKFGKKQIWILSVAITLGLVLILFAILLPFIIKNNGSKYPRAVIELTDGRKIELVVWEEDCPIAATNFLFLCKIHFFDGVILYDVQQDHNFMRFGGRTGYGTKETRFNNESFMEGISTDIFNVVRLEDIDNTSYQTNAKKNKFGYWLKKDSSWQSRRYSERYAVSYNTNRQSADFIINLADNNTDFRSNTTNHTEYLTAFANIQDAKSQQVVEDILALAKNPNTGLGDAIGTDPVIRIRTVTLKNMNKKKWKNFEFVSYMNKALKTESNPAGVPAWAGWSA